MGTLCDATMYVGYGTVFITPLSPALSKKKCVLRKQRLKNHTPKDEKEKRTMAIQLLKVRLFGLIIIVSHRSSWKIVVHIFEKAEKHM